MPNETALMQATNQPIDTDEQLCRLLTALLGKAVQRQCWLVFFTERRTPIELLIPIEDLPYEPDDHVEDFAGVVRSIVERSRASEIVIAWERVGGPDPMPSEQLWIAAVARAFAAADIDVRAQVVVHDDGVRLVDVDAVRAAAAALSAEPAGAR